VLAKIDGTDYNTEWVDQTGGGVTDHGGLTGLGDDDHTQYALADGTRGLFQRAQPDQFAVTSSDFTVDGVEPGYVLYVGGGGDTLTLPSADAYAGQAYFIVAGLAAVDVVPPAGEFINGFLTSYTIESGNVVGFAAYTGGSWLTVQRAGSMFDLPDYSAASVADVLTIGAGGSPE